MRRAILLLSSCPLSLLVIAQPVNDEPCTALSLVVSETCTWTTADNVDATLTTNVPTPDCGALSNGDVWYAISVPPTGLLRIETEAGTIPDAAMALYAAPSCEGPFTLLACDDDAGPGQMPLLDLTGLDPSSVLYLRTWGYNGATGEFGLCAHAILEYPEGDCIYQLELFDSFGDGWGTGARIGFSVNGGPFIYDSLATGSYASRLIGVDLGDMVTLNYTAGQENNENTVILGLWGTAGAYYLGSNMSTNAGLYTGLVDCQPPPPLAGDCGYAAWLCTDTLFPQGALMNGFTADLDPSNEGCLGGGENTGIWTQFTVATAGTLGFTLSPAWSSDFDFAIWGPVDAMVCPPVGAPIRCSYGSLAGPTGLSASAQDNSESAGGDGWVRYLDVMAGERYVLYIDNFSSDSSPVDLTWQLDDGASLQCPPAPEAQFQILNATIQPGGSCTFIDLSSNAPVAWSWSFPGGMPSSSIEQDPAGITYALPGCYEVSLTAYNSGGGGTSTQPCIVMVDQPTGWQPVTDTIQFVLTAAGCSLRIERGEELDAFLFDAAGRTVLTGHGTGRIELSTIGLGAGHYTLLARSERNFWSRRLVIAR